MSAAASKPTRPLGIPVLALALAGVSATGKAEPESIAMMTGVGLPAWAATLAIHSIPVVLAVALLLIGRAVTRKRSTGVKWIIYGLLGMIVGMVTAFHMELFAGVPGLIEAANGPLVEAETVEVALWTLGGFGVIMAVTVGAIAMFGSNAAQALQVEECEPEMLEVRRAERSFYAYSAFGMATLGIACMALAVARQSLPDMRVGPLLIAGIAAVASVGANWILWRQCDELQRRTVVNGYAVSAVAATLGAFSWAIAAAAGYVGQVDAAAAFVALTVIQLVATASTTATMMGKAFNTTRPA